MLYLPTIISVVEVLLITVPVLLVVAFVTVAERKTMASMQRRLGPNMVGYYGLLQAFANVLKLLLKEYVSPTQANLALFFLGPIITLIFGLLGYLVIPYAPGLALNDLNLGILYMLAVSSLSTYGILSAGWSANSKYAFLGSLRSTAQLISYELILSSAILLVVMLIGSLNLTVNMEAQRVIWFIIPLFVFFFASFNTFSIYNSILWFIFSNSFYTLYLWIPKLLGLLFSLYFLGWELIPVIVSDYLDALAGWNSLGEKPLSIPGSLGDILGLLGLIPYWLLMFLIAWYLRNNIDIYCEIDLLPRVYTNMYGENCEGIIDLNNTGGYLLQFIYIGVPDTQVQTVNYQGRSYNGIFKTNGQRTLLTGENLIGMPGQEGILVGDQILITFPAPNMLHWRSLRALINLTITNLGSLIDPEWRVNHLDNTITVFGYLSNMQP